MVRIDSNFQKYDWELLFEIALDLIDYYLVYLLLIIGGFHVLIYFQHKKSETRQ